MPAVSQSATSSSAARGRLKDGRADWLVKFRDDCIAHFREKRQQAVHKIRARRLDPADELSQGRIKSAEWQSDEARFHEAMLAEWQDWQARLVQEAMELGTMGPDEALSLEHEMHHAYQEERKIELEEELEWYEAWEKKIERQGLEPDLVIEDVDMEFVADTQGTTKRGVQELCSAH